MKSFLILVLAIVFSSSVFAKVSLNSKWTQPLQYEDGSQLKYSEILEYRVYYTFGDKIDQKNDEYVKVDGRENLIMEIDVPENVKTNTVRFAVSAVTIYNTESVLSNVLTRTFEVEKPEETKPNPKPPTIVTFTVECDGECVIKMVEPSK